MLNIRSGACLVLNMGHIIHLFTVIWITSVSVNGGIRKLQLFKLDSNSNGNDAPSQLYVQDVPTFSHN